MISITTFAEMSWQQQDAWFEPHYCYDFAAKRWQWGAVRVARLGGRRGQFTHCSSHRQQDLHSHLHDAILLDDEPRNRWHSESH
jgi:hypothetical protein